MTMMESTSPIAIAAPLMMRNLLTTMFIFADKPFILLAEKYKVLEIIRYVLISIFLFILRVLPSLFPCLIPSGEDFDYPLKPRKNGYRKGGENFNHAAVYGGASGVAAAGGGGGDTGIARALSQLLSLVNDIPVSSRKYEVVRSLAEKIIDENLIEGNEGLREINCRVLSAAFSRTLSQLEAVMIDHQGGGGGVVGGDGDVMIFDDYYYKVRRLLKGVKYYGDVLWRRGMARDGEGRCRGSSAEKLAAELLWLVQKMKACGCDEEAVYRWASATNLAWVSLSAEPRLQGSLVKVSAFLIKQAKNMTGRYEFDEGAEDQLRQTKMKMLMSWLPLLCRGSNGTDAPVLSISERAELEKTLEEIIETLDREEEQEQVLSLWLHHFTYCASSDWPNLQKCYTQWCNTSRGVLLLQY